MEPEVPIGDTTEAEQRELLRRLGSLETEQFNLEHRLETITEELSAASMRLEDIRITKLTELLDTRLLPLKLGYTMLPDGNIGVFALSGGEAAFAQFDTVVEDPANASVNEVLNYLETSVPWVTDA